MAVHGLLTVVASFAVVHGLWGTPASVLVAHRLWITGLVVVHTGLLALLHVESPWTRDRTDPLNWQADS